MALTLRTLVIAASLCTTLPLTAQASVLTLDFESLNLVPGTNLDLTSNPQPYASQKLSFSGSVEAEKWSSGTAGGLPSPPVGPHFAGGVSFDLAIDSSGCTSANAGSVLGCFNRLNMRTLAAGGSITIFDSLNNSMPFPLGGGSGGTSAWTWLSATTPIETLGLISRIEFRSTVGIYIDDLSMSYDGSVVGGPGGSLPEPGGLALVALALAGLGLTRRRVGRPAQG